MKNDFTKINLFSCPIYKVRIDPNSYDKEKIINDIKYNKSLKNTRNDPHQIIGNLSDTHHSYQDFDNVNFRTINYEKLSSAYLEIFKEFFDEVIYTAKEFKYAFKIVNYSAMTEGQWLPVHNHIPDDFATIHYLNFKEDHNQTRFYNPAIFTPFLKFIQPELYNTLDSTDLDNSYLWESGSFTVEEDDILIFPAALNHEIMRQGPTNEPRITISSNLRILSQEEK